tara:strand:+ start:16 stop:780 length:765 start_codon:yes stop_codon:yes gene_type:complete
MGQFFTVDVKPTIAASKQHAAFAAGDVLFGWTEFEVPKGSHALLSVTALVRPKGDATPTVNRFPFSLVFAKTDDTSLGTVNDAADHVPNNDFLGQIEFEAANFSHSALQSTAVVSTGKGSNSGTTYNPMVLTPDPTTGSSVGYNKLYVGCIAAGAFDFSSINAIAEDGDAEAASTQVITMDGTSMDVREHFIDGDIVHIGTSVGTPAADSLIGTVASADSSTQITLDAVSATALVDGDILYNIHPMRLILSFAS